SGVVCAAASVTGVGGICGGPPACSPRVQAPVATTAKQTAAAAGNRRDMGSWTLGKKMRFRGRAGAQSITGRRTESHARGGSTRQCAGGITTNRLRPPSYYVASRHIV